MNQVPQCLFIFHQLSHVMTRLLSHQTIIPLKTIKPRLQKFVAEGFRRKRRRPGLKIACLLNNLFCLLQRLESRKRKTMIGKARGNHIRLRRNPVNNHQSPSMAGPFKVPFSNTPKSANSCELQVKSQDGPEPHIALHRRHSPHLQGQHLFNFKTHSAKLQGTTVCPPEPVVSSTA